MSKRKTVNFLPVHFRTDANERFFSGTLDQLIQQPSLKKIDGFIGSKFVKNYNPATDSYLNETTGIREQYELEPSIVLRNSITEQTEFTKNYEDILNAISYFGADISNQDSTFKQQSYAWTPYINWDKFVNYRNYVWVPNGPETITVTGPEPEIASTIKVKIVTDELGSYWNFSTDGVAYNPTLTLYRGLNYIFEVDSVDQPFYIKTRRTTGSSNILPGVLNNGTVKGSVVFQIQDSTPGTLFYLSGNDPTIFGKFLIRDLVESTQLDVINDIIGKKTYSFGNAIPLSNGMHITFNGNITPESYKGKTYLVEGVGNSITLIDVEQLVTIESYGSIVDTSFDQFSFDELPFDSVSNYPLTPDYITINSASKDKNAWSRYNRWVHIDVLNVSAELNGTHAEIDFNNRAQRPIIEFNPNIKLFNFGVTAKNYVNYLDTSVTDVFSTIEGSRGFYVDGQSLQEGNRVIFLADTDADVKNKTYVVRYLDINGVQKIHLEEDVDAIPNEGDSVLITAGTNNGRKTFHFKNGNWVKSQVKSGLNQAPLFDIFDKNTVSYGDELEYKNTNFIGNTVFSYQVGSGVVDSVLGFPIVYNNISNVGAYMFEMSLFSQSNTYISNDVTVDISSKDGFLLIDNNYYNGWTKCNEESKQNILEIKTATGGETFVEVTSVDILTPVESFTIYKNGTKCLSTEYSITKDTEYDKIYLNFTTALVENDVINIEVQPNYAKKEFGQYETPTNLTNNPLNEYASTLSYAEILDHVNSIITNAPTFNNLRDTVDLEQYGRRFVQHEGLVSLAGLFLTEKEYNVVNALRWSGLEYQKFKISIIQKFNELSNYLKVSDALDNILIDMSKENNVNTPFYFSDMLPFGLNRKVYSYTVKNTDVNSYALGTEPFNNTVLSNQAVLVYINDQQLTYGLDYVFDTVNPLVIISKTLNLNDVIDIKTYSNTAGACMPPSPTKLGLYPAFRPTKFIDNTYLNPVEVIQGHDGSITVAYGDARDNLILELETRIFNNLKTKYDISILDINSILPGRFRKNTHTLTQINQTLGEEFLRWAGFYNIDYVTNDNAQYESVFGYNFSTQADTIDGNLVTGSWKNIYRYYYDTDRPHTRPWEMLGFSEEPSWWESEYGTAPFTSGNSILWEDLEKGYIRQGDRQGYDEFYARPGLLQIIPVDSYGDLLDPLQTNIIKTYNPAHVYKNWTFGEVGPAENAWRKSSLYPFALQISMALNLPAKYLTLGYDVSRNIKNLSGQLIYADTSERIQPNNLKVFGTVVDGKSVLTAGYHNYIVEYARQKHQDAPIKIKDLLDRLAVSLTYKIGGFTSKDKFRIALETVTNYKAADTVFVPSENYEIILNVSTPIDTLAISAIIIERGDTGYIVKGYDKVNPYFKIYNPIHKPNDKVVTIGGVSENFIYWAENSNILGGTVVANGNKYYRAISDHITKNSFDSAQYYPLPYLPMTGGVEVSVAASYEEAVTVIPYGQILTSTQDVYDFVVGYGEWLTQQGFEFSSNSEELQTVANWDLAGKEFLYWSLQRWAVNSIISLSPFSNSLIYNSNKSVVDNIYDSFYEYSLLKVDGRTIDKTNVDISRDGNKFTISTARSKTDGIFFAKINLVQKEHCLVMDNKTIFNDLIYSTTSGYRQHRFKVKGFVTDNWEGDFYVPGFVYDDAMIDDWQINVDYHVGDVVKYQTKYYQAIQNILATDTFDYENWSLLGKKPVAQLLPNFEYKIQQFEDFYSLDNVSFDASQQKFAQKIIGYVPRNYLNSLIPDETSQYKFYQGFIREKGTTLPLEKFSVANNSTLGSHIELQEEWAIRLGSFGAENSYKEIEFMLDQDQFSQDPQIFEFVVDSNKISNSPSYKLLPDQVLTKSIDYNGNPWPTLDVSTANGNGYNQYHKFPVAGYVRLDDVTYTGLYSNNILSLASNTALKEGDTIWIAMDTVGNWDVRRYTLSSASIINYGVDNNEQYISFNTDMPHGLAVRDFVSITRLDDPINGIYEVLSIPAPETFIVKTTLNDLAGPSTVLNGKIYTFKSSRFATKDDLANLSGLARWQNCEYVWIDNDGDGTWAVYEKEDSLDAYPMRPYVSREEENFGNTIVVGKYSKNIVVSAPNLEKGRVYLYNRTTKGTDDLTILQSYLFDDSVSDLLSIQDQYENQLITEIKRLHGSSLDIWENESLTNCYIVSGAPGTSNAKWKHGSVDDNTDLKYLDFNYNISTYLEEGAIKLSKFNATTGLYVKDIIIASPVAEANARFGHNVKFVGTTKPTLFVSAPGQDSGNGEVFIFELDQNNAWSVHKNNNQTYRLRSELPSINNDANFGWDIAASTDGKTVVVSAPGYVYNNTSIHTGAVFVFSKDGSTNNYTLSQTIKADDYLKPSDISLKGVQKTYSDFEVVTQFDAPTNSLIRTTGNFLSDGFRIGQKVNVAGTLSNDGDYVIVELYPLKMVFNSIIGVTTETVAGTMTLTGQGSRRDDRFGDSMVMTADGNTLIVSSDHASSEKFDSGLLYVFKLTAGQYTLIQTIESPTVQTGELFGSNMSLSDDGESLLVAAIGSGQSLAMYFDSYTGRLPNSNELYGSNYVLDPTSSLQPIRTTFDSGSTNFASTSRNSGAVYLYQKLNDKYVYGESLNSGDSAAYDGYGTGLYTDGISYFIGSPNYDYVQDGVKYSNSGTVVIFDRKYEDLSIKSWTKVRKQDQLIDVEKIKKVITYNNVDSQIIDQYEIIDPVKGKIPSTIANEIKYMTPYDPATYTVAVNATNKVRVDNKTTWWESHVGELWFDLSTLRYTWYEQGSLEYRNNNWGKLFPGSTVDVYEWVKSDYRPSEWSQLADTTEGLALGISGQPKYPDNSVVSVNQYYDPVINDFVNVYFFWVRNKVTLPDLSFRSLSAFECSRIIEDPKGQGIKYAAFLDTNAVSLANSKKTLNADKINIDIFYDTSDVDNNRHTQWQLINESNPYLNIDSSFEVKLFDSLVGQDKLGNLVPDPALSPKAKTGNLFRPRQSWFKNKDAALKVLLNYTNKILLENDIVGKVDLSNLNKYDVAPELHIGAYDQIVDVLEDISGLGINGKITAELSAVIVNGRFVSVSIDEPGYGYKIAPTVKIVGDGSGAVIQTAIDQLGRVTGVTIVRQGSGYLSVPTLMVRPFAVLVNYDAEIGKWAIYYLNSTSKEFERHISQRHDVRKYWSYVDWRDGSFKEDTSVKFTVKYTSDLETALYAVDDVIEVENPGDGKKIVVQRVADGTGNIYNNYNLIYREKGTIQFNSALYDKTLSGIGYDTVSRYDQMSFDESNAIETRLILEAIKNDIFVLDLAHYWSKFFFVAIRYVLSEQLFVDWVYKTSFVTPFISSGSLDQRPVYRVNDFGYVEEFIKEIKPFRTKLRDITIDYSSIEKLGLGTTDFDLPSYVDPITGVVTVPDEVTIATKYPFKHWDLNHTYGIESITVNNPGANYRVAPIVTIVGNGTGAKASAFIIEGKVTRITVTDPGTGYTETPEVIITGGGNYTSNFVRATAYPNLSNKKVRTNTIGMKFDRTSEYGLYTGERLSRNYVTNGSTLFYVLAYPVDSSDTNYPALQDENEIHLYLNDAEIPKENYRITFRDDMSTVIGLNVALPKDQQLRISYIKNSLYTLDTFYQLEASSLIDTFKLTFAPELDKKKITIKVVNTITGGGTDVPISDYVVQLKQLAGSYKKYVGYIKFKNPPPVGSKITIQYSKNINIQNSVDRVINYYAPTLGMPGKDVTQLMKGIEFGGVEIQGLNFSVSAGWDGLPWFGQGWDTYINENQDLLVVSDGVTSTYSLGYVPMANTAINIYFDNVRVDDENFGTANQTNENALFETIYPDGISDYIDLPLVPASGVKIAVRLSISDGVIMPSDTSVLDTNLSGGDFTTYLDAGTTRLKTASGIKADDIAVDGGEFISVEHSPATEELVKGEIFDTVSISVFNSPSVGSNLITTNQFIADGSTRQFTVDKILVSFDQLDVYIGNALATYNTDYTVTQNANNTTTIGIITSDYGFGDVENIRTTVNGYKSAIASYNDTIVDLTDEILQLDGDIATLDVQIQSATTSLDYWNHQSGNNPGQSAYIQFMRDQFSNLLIQLNQQKSIKVALRIPKQNSLTTAISGKTSTEILLENLRIIDIVITVQTIGIGGSDILYKHTYVATADDEIASKIDIVSPVKFTDVGSFYVTVAGEVIADANINKFSASKLQKFAGKSNRAKVTLDNSLLGITEGMSITLMMFASKVKSYSEKYNQEITIDTSTTYPLARPPGNIAPLHVMAIVSRDGLRLLPPETEYYDVTQNEQVFSIGENIPYITRTLSNADVEVYLNGKILIAIRDYNFDNTTNTVTMNSGIAQTGDVVAITVLKNANYTIQNSSITFNSSANLQAGQKIIVTTYTNHDTNLMRREIFEGNLKNEFKLSRPVFNINDIWIDLNGQPLTPNFDFRLSSDGYYVNISKRFTVRTPVWQPLHVYTVLPESEPIYVRYSNKIYICNESHLSTGQIDLTKFQEVPYDTPGANSWIPKDDRIVVTSISDIISTDSIAYRIFKDMSNKQQYKRISNHDSTILTTELSITDLQVNVADASIFGTVIEKSNKPKVMFIGGERIEFFSVTGNTLGLITRGTRGTGPKTVYPIGTRVYSGGDEQSVPYQDGMITQTVVTPSNYRYNDGSSTYEQLTAPDVWTPVANNFATYVLENFNFSSTVNYEDQVSLYMAGKMLMKPAKSNNPLIKHDFTITYDSNEVNSLGETGDVVQAPDFTINKVGNDYVLTINPDTMLRDIEGNVVSNLQIKIMQRIGKIWYSTNSEVTLQQQTTIQGKFLQEYPAELPDKYYYGIIENQDNSLITEDLFNVPYVTDESGGVITDEDGNPLEIG
jgi:hypothetical protein